MSLWEMIQPPEDISTNGKHIDWLFNYITLLDIFYFILVCAGLFGFSFFYSAKRNSTPYYTHGNKRNHILITFVIGLSIFVSIDSVIATISSYDLKEYFWNYPNEDKEDVVRVEVLAQQWGWNFRHAGRDEIFNTEDDVVNFNNLRVPANKKIVFQLTSKDVIHSFSLPNARYKVDAIPGRVSRMWTELTKPGTYEIVCAEMCGTNHYKMKAKLTVYTQEDFNAWYEEQMNIAIQANDEENPDVFWGWKWEYK